MIEIDSKLRHDTVDRDEVDRLRKRFMKLDKVWSRAYTEVKIRVLTRVRALQDNSGTIERDEFLSLPQVSSNPLATRYGHLPLFSCPVCRIFTFVH